MIQDIKKYTQQGTGLEVAVDMTEVQMLEQSDTGCYINLKGGHMARVKEPYGKVLKDWLDSETFKIGRVKEGGLGF